MGSICSASWRVFCSLTHCALREPKPENISYFEIVVYAWDVDDMYQVRDIRRRYPHIVGTTTTCRVCNRNRRVDTDFSGNQVRNLCNFRPKRKGQYRVFMGLLCRQCSKKQKKETAERKRLATEIIYAQYPHLRDPDNSYKASASSQDPMRVNIYDANRDLDYYGISCKEDFDSA